MMLAMLSDVAGSGDTPPAAGTGLAAQSTPGNVAFAVVPGAQGLSHWNLQYWPDDPALGSPGAALTVHEWGPYVAPDRLLPGLYHWSATVIWADMSQGPTTTGTFTVPEKELFITSFQDLRPAYPVGTPMAVSTGPGAADFWSASWQAAYYYFPTTHATRLEAQVTSGGGGNMTMTFGSLIHTINADGAPHTWKIDRAAASQLYVWDPSGSRKRVWRIRAFTWAD